MKSGLDAMPLFLLDDLLMEIAVINCFQSCPIRNAEISFKNTFLLPPLSNTVDRICLFMMRLIFDRTHLEIKCNNKFHRTTLWGLRPSTVFTLVQSDMLQFRSKTINFSCVIGILLSQKAINNLEENNQIENCGSM